MYAYLVTCKTPSDTSVHPISVHKCTDLWVASSSRLRTLEFLSQGEACGSEIAATFDEPLSTVSHRMKLLEQAGLVSRRKEGRHVYFGLLDEHVLHLVRDALDHAME